MLCLVLQCFIYNLTIASVFNNTGSFDPCFPRRSILSAVANKRLILILAQFLARHLRVKISHALREVTVKWLFPSKTKQIQVKILPATNEYDFMQRGFGRPTGNKVISAKAAFTLSPRPISYLEYNYRCLCCHHTSLQTTGNR